jgi:hypothetical protein
MSSFFSSQGAGSPSLPGARPRRRVLPRRNPRAEHGCGPESYRLRTLSVASVIPRLRMIPGSTDDSDQMIPGAGLDSWRNRTIPFSSVLSLTRLPRRDLSGMSRVDLDARRTRA